MHAPFIVFASYNVADLQVTFHYKQAKVYASTKASQSYDVTMYNDLNALVVGIPNG